MKIVKSYKFRRIRNTWDLKRTIRSNSLYFVTKSGDYIKSGFNKHYTLNKKLLKRFIDCREQYLKKVKTNN